VKHGLQHFDNWAADFGEVVSALELAPSGQKYKVRERFAKFVNLPELMGLFGKVADIQKADMLKLPVPEVATGKPIVVAVDPSPELREYTQLLVKRSEAIQQRLVSPEKDNMLKVTADGRKAALDMRCIYPDAEDYSDSKVNSCVRKVFDIYEETKAQKSTQMIFCDISTPDGKDKPFEMAEADGRFVIDQKQFTNVYDDIKEKLLNNGIPEKEIAYIHDADTDEKKEKLFAQVRRGEVRILLGSTQKMGSGTNAQTKLIALHHLDCPYRPSDLEQRNGRIVRQGNTNPEVQIYQYVTKNSFDSYLWQIVESKQKFISQVMSGKSPSREMEDIDETVLNYAEVKAIATGNPKIKRKMELDIEVQRLQILEAQYRASKYSLENDALKKYPQEIANFTETIAKVEANISIRDKNPLADFQITIGQHIYSERKEAGELLLKMISSNQYNDKVAGIYRGFEIIPQEMEYIGESPKVWLKGTMSHSVELSSSSVGSMERIENCIKTLEKVLSEKTRGLETVQNQFEASKLQLSRPFEQETELQSALSELTQVNMELDIDRSNDTDIVMTDDEEENEESDGKTSENDDFKKPVFIKEADDYEDELEVG